MRHPTIPADAHHLWYKLGRVAYTWQEGSSYISVVAYQLFDRTLNEQGKATAVLEITVAGDCVYIENFRSPENLGDEVLLAQVDRLSKMPAYSGAEFQHLMTRLVEFRRKPPTSGATRLGIMWSAQPPPSV